MYLSSVCLRLSVPLPPSRPLPSPSFPTPVHSTHSAVFTLLRPHLLLVTLSCGQVRADLLDTHIAICSPEVLMMFSDNFDYQSLKRDFVVGTLSEEELGKKIYLHILQVMDCSVGLGSRGGGRGSC